MTGRDATKIEDAANQAAILKSTLLAVHSAMFESVGGKPEDYNWALFGAVNQSHSLAAELQRLTDEFFARIKKEATA